MATLSIWNRVTRTTRFSVVAFVVSIALSILSMGALGYAVYYLVAPLLPRSIDTLQGDTMWPSIILAGMAWSLGFLLAGLAMHYLKSRKFSLFIHVFVYTLIIWLWTYAVWFTIIEGEIIQ